MCRAYHQSQSQLVSALFLLEKRCSSTNRLIWGFGKQPRLSIIGDSGSLPAFCAHLCTGWQETLENYFPLPVSQYPHLKISVFLMIFEMHEELHIITLTGFYTRTSHGSKQAQKPINNLAILPSHAWPVLKFQLSWVHIVKSIWIFLEETL